MRDRTRLVRRCLLHLRSVVILRLRRLRRPRLLPLQTSRRPDRRFLPSDPGHASRTNRNPLRRSPRSHRWPPLLRPPRQPELRPKAHRPDRLGRHPGTDSDVLRCTPQERRAMRMRQLLPIEVNRSCLESDLTSHFPRRQHYSMSSARSTQQLLRNCEEHHRLTTQPGTHGVPDRKTAGRRPDRERRLPKTWIAEAWDPGPGNVLAIRSRQVAGRSGCGRAPNPRETTSTRRPDLRTRASE